MNAPESIYLVGINAIAEALRTGAPIEKVYVRYGSTLPPPLRRLVAEADIQLTELSREKFDRLVRQIGGTRHHPTAIALRQMYRTAELDQVLTIPQHTGSGLVVVCDRVSDPHNFGAIVRTAVAGGADAVITSTHDSAPITPVTIAAASGAFEHIPIVRTASLVAALDRAKHHGWWIIGSSSDGEQLYTDRLYDRPVMLVVGSEGSGMRRSIQRLCDVVVRIPLDPRMESLNVSVATGIMLFEIRRQRTNDAGLPPAATSTPLHVATAAQDQASAGPDVAGLD
ncbi:MAG: 23S rRNA (guanosine(2251)-2'-O)-methyltransferase RlmB [Chlorobi bacterium]|nr:23S rRNA (guanosine(2251)-2'-O)-methyltransferase RlmB [Chlorobiota bacterium]